MREGEIGSHGLSILYSDGARSREPIKESANHTLYEYHIGRANKVNQLRPWGSERAADSGRCAQRLRHVFNVIPENICRIFAFTRIPNSLARAAESTGRGPSTIRVASLPLRFTRPSSGCWARETPQQPRMKRNLRPPTIIDSFRSVPFLKTFQK